MTIDFERTLEHVMATGDEWQSMRALRLAGDVVDGSIAIPGQDGAGGVFGRAGRLSPGATGATLCHLVVAGFQSAPAGVIAADWLEEARTPAGAWLDSPDSVPGDLDDYAGGRVWATASASCALLAVGRDPGPRALELLRTEADHDGRFTGGAHPTFAAAGAYWQAEGARTEIAEWALRWAREWSDETWGAWDYAAALTYWAAASVPGEHESVQLFLDELEGVVATAGALDDLELTLRTLELLRHFES